MAKKNMITISAEWNDLLDILSFDESGKIFYLIRKFESLTIDALTVLEAGMEFSNQAIMIWNKIKNDLADMVAAKKAKSAKAAASARARWGSKEPEQVPGQSELKYVITSESDRPEVRANAMRMQCECNANASPIYNNINKINNTHTYSECEIVKLFLEYGSTEAEAKKYYEYYTKRHWITLYGKKITDVVYSVKKWIARNARRNERKSSAPIQVPATTTTSRTRRKTPVFCDIEQRQYNYDELLLQING